MNILQITNAANVLTDETFNPNVVMTYVNQVISKINVQLKARLPRITDVSAEYVALNDSWCEFLFVPFVCYSIKTNDGSLQEADRFNNTFLENFETLKENRYDAITETYRLPDFEGIYQRNLRKGINEGWFGNGTSGSEGFE